MNIAIASGKGGTGKTTFSVNLAYYLSKKRSDVVLIDSDVEEPNCHIFLEDHETKREPVYTEIPVIDHSLCTFCGKCSELCEFNALAVLKTKVMVFNELCHACGGCERVCPEHAISYKNREIGTIDSGKFKDLSFLYGTLNISETMSPPIIRTLKSKTDARSLNIIDCPPGTACPTVAAIDDVDAVLLVTEPTPFGLNDLKLIVTLTELMNIPTGIIINKSSEHDAIIEKYAAQKNLIIVSRIPENRKIAEMYSKGKIIVEQTSEYDENFKKIEEFLQGITL